MIRWGSFLRGVVARLEWVRQVPHPGCRASLHVRSPILLILWLIFLTWAVLRPVPFARAGFAFTTALILIGYVWARAMAASVTTRRVLRFTALQVGDQLEETLVLENRSWLPVIFAEFVDQTSLPGYSIDGVRAGASRATRQWRSHAVCRQRGVFSLGHWEVRLGDPFCLFEARQGYVEPEEITVYPLLADLPAGATRHQTLGDRSALRQALRADTVSAVTTRPYLSGDSLRHIHWRTTARRDELFVRIFEPEALSATWIVLDTDEAVHVGRGSDSSFEKMIMAAASFAASLLDQGLPVGLVLEGERSRIVPPQFTRGDLWTILRALALVGPGPVPLASALDRAASLLTARDATAILTPSLNPEWIRHLPARASSAAGRQQVWLFDPASFGGHGSAEGLARSLRQRGTPTLVLRRDDIRPRAGSVARVRRWDPRPSDRLPSSSSETSRSGRLVVAPPS